MERICKRCLIRESDQAELFQNMYQYIAGLDASIKASNKHYEERLAHCKTCKWLHEGVCGACGCFVEMRAVVAKRSCPYEYWVATTETEEEEINAKV